MLIEQTRTEDIVEHLQPGYTNLLLVSEHSKVDIHSLIRVASEKGIKIAGGIFPGLLYDDRRVDNGIILKLLDGDSQVSICQGLSQNHLDIDLPDVDDTVHSAIILLDGLTKNIPRFLERVYEKYWNTLNYVGGGCGSLSLTSQPCVFSNDGFFMDAALMIYIKNNMTIGVKHGWKKIAGPFIVSKSSENVIKEINWKPAFKVYKNIVDKHQPTPITEYNFFDIAKGFPFGISREGFEDVVRDPIMTADSGSLTCVGEVNNNTTVNILIGEPKELVACAEEAAALALKNGSVSSVLVVDCISRALFLEGDFNNELRAINHAIKHTNDQIILEGVLSLGEISSYGEGYLEFFNKTIVVSSFG